MSERDGPFKQELERVKEALDTGTNAALVSEPYGGREALLDELASCANGKRCLSFGSVADAEGDIPEGADVCFVEGCRYLYTRRIGGFGPLEDFLEEVAASGATVVASWNTHAWSYARHATGIGDVFGKEVILPTLAAPRIAEMIASEYDVSEFESDLEGIRQESESLADRLPARVRLRLNERSENAFEKVAARSGGNPGVARTVFEGRTWKRDTDEAELSYEDSFVLLIVLTKEEVKGGVLEEVVSPRSLERNLSRLSDAGYVETDGDSVTLCPERLVDTVELLERRNLVW